MLNGIRQHSRILRLFQPFQPLSVHYQEKNESIQVSSLRRNEKPIYTHIHIYPQNFINFIIGCAFANAVIWRKNSQQAIFQTIPHTALFIIIRMPECIFFGTN